MKFDVGGQVFDIEEILLIRYKETPLAKCIKHASGEDKIIIDRDPKYFREVLKFMKDPSSLPFHRMSSSELKILQEEAKFYGIEEMVRACEVEGDLYERIDTVLSGEKLYSLLEDETRFVIFLNDKYWLANSDNRKEVQKQLSYINRDKCLVLGFAIDAEYFAINEDSTIRPEGDTIFSDLKSLELVLYDAGRCRVVFSSKGDKFALTTCILIANTNSLKVIKWNTNPKSDKECRLQVEDALAELSYRIHMRRMLLRLQE